MAMKDARFRHDCDHVIDVMTEKGFVWTTQEDFEDDIYDYRVDTSFSPGNLVLALAPIDGELTFDKYDMILS